MNIERAILKSLDNKNRSFFSYYEGHLPVLVTSDVEIIQEVFVKQFGNFMARKVFKSKLIIFII